MHVRHAILAVAAALSAAAAAAEPTTVSVGVCEMPGIFEFEGGEPTGAIADVWADIASRAGIQSRFVPERNIAALIADTAAGRIDVLLGPLAMTEARERQVDFTHPVMMSGMRIAVPGGPDRPWLAPLLSLVSREMLTVVLAIIALVIVTAHVLWFVERIRNPQAFPAGYREGVWEAIWWSISTIVTGGCEDKPIETTAGRAVAIVWMLGGITVVATLTGTIAARLTAEHVTGSIHGPRDLPGRVVGVMEESVASESVRARGGSVMVYAKLEDALAALRAGEIDGVVYENHILQAMLARPENASLRLVGSIFDTYDFALAVPPGSPLREPLSTAILAAREDGTIARLMERNLGRHE